MKIGSLSAVRRLVWVLAMMSAESAVFAQQPTSTTATASDSLAEIVVTAQKRSERLQDVPITIVALSDEDLNRAGVETTRDLPSVVSGLVWANQGAWVQPSLRGVYTNVAAVGAPSPVAIYLDGVYQPLQAGTIMDLPDINRIEVLKGPQGTLFGRNATAGAISIYTLDPSFTPTGMFSVSGGAYSGGSSQTSGHYATSAFVSGPLADNTLAGSLSAYYDRTDGYYTNDLNGNTAGRINAAVLRGKLLWQISDSIKIVGTAYYIHRDDQTVEAGFPFGGATSASFYPGAIIPTQPWHYSYDGYTPTTNPNGRGGSINATLDFDAGTLTSITGYTDYNIYSAITAQGAYGGPSCVAAFACVDGQVWTPDQAWSQEFDFASKQMGRFRYVAGLFGFYNKASERDVYNVTAFIDDTTTKDASYAGFAEGTVDVTDQFSVIAGIRVNHDKLEAVGSYFAAPEAVYANKGWTSTTPRLSLTYKFSPAVNTYFTYSQGFKAGIVSGQITTAPPANPEKISSYEVGLKAAQNDYSLNLAAFYYDYRDLQVEVFENFVTVPLNAAKAEIYGIDFDGAVKPTQEFELRLNTTYLPKAEYTSFPDAIVFVPPLTPSGLTTNTSYNATGGRMLVTPRWTGTLSGNYTRVLAQGTFEANASVYHSNSYIWEYTGTVNTGAYDLLNGQLSFTPAASQFKYTLYGKNLTNKAYIQGALPTAYSHQVIFGAPREIGLRLNYSF